MAKKTIEELNEIFGTACRLQEKGQLVEAEGLYLELLKDFSDAPILHYNLGLLYFEREDFERATASFQRGLERMPDDPDLLFNHALAMKACGRLREAQVGFHRLVKMQPDDVDTLYNLAGCHRELGEFAEAIATYQRVLQLVPEHLSAHKNLAWTAHSAGTTELAVAHFSKITRLDPDNQSAAHMLAAIRGDTAETTPQEYVAEIFDNYAGRYEQSLVEELGYRVPQQLLSLLTAIDGDRNYESVLDLGCGTGLAGELFADQAGTLVGIDLAAEMVALARAKELYTTLMVTDIKEFLQTTKGSYELIVAADVFGYLGAMEEVFLGVGHCATREARLLFSTELGSGTVPELRPSGRFAHPDSYIRKTSQAAGWKLLSSRSAELRRERGRQVIGTLWLFSWDGEPR
jgi:predicted TPR repeat methyltransferase